MIFTKKADLNIYVNITISLLHYIYAHTLKDIGNLSCIEHA